MSKYENYSVKQEITTAVMQLMTEKTYMDITVTDIVNRAGVARASFYRNFASINEVLEMIVDGLSAELLEDVIPVLHSSDERKWREFLFNHFYRFIQNQKKMTDICFENISVLLNRIDDKIQEKEASMPTETLHDRYSVVGKMGLINSITKKWMDNGAKETPEEMINYIMSFITKF